MPPAILSVAMTACVWGLWGYTHWGSLRWLFSTLDAASNTNLGLALGVGAIVAWKLLGRITKAKGSSSAWSFRMRCYGHWWPLAVAVGGGFGSLLLKPLVDIPQLNVMLLSLGTYGLLGLHLTPRAWKQGWPVTALVTCILPFSTQFQTGLGVPARVMTAHLVERAMHLWHVAAISANDIILLENGIAHVDLPCSGLKSLWTGGVFVLLVTLLEQRQLGLRWLLAACGTLFCLFWANAVRVFLLVAIAYGLGARSFAEVLHLPLGLIGFCLSCGVGWLLLQWVPKADTAARDRPACGNPEQLTAYVTKDIDRLNRRWQVGLVTILAAFAIASNGIAPLVSQGAISAIQLPQQFNATPLPLSQVEAHFFNQPTIPIAEKWQFDWDGVSGSMLVVVAQDWKSHHPPELCFAGNGFQVDAMQETQLAKGLDARWLSLEHGKLSATYWFQSPQGTTDEYIARFWQSITHPDTPWVMVSILFDRPLLPGNEQIESMATALQDAISHSFAVSSANTNSSLI
ncbi:MAG: exosortase O [Synechococcus sp.]